MCLGVPGKVVETWDSSTGMKMGNVSFSGIVKQICLEFTPDADAGDYVIVHVGFAVNKLDETEARQILDLLDQIEERATGGQASAPESL